MESEMYDGTVHPEVWLNKVKYNCYQNNITTDENILNCCKTLIHPSINNVAETKSFVELINVLKSHFFYDAFKNSVKRKLQTLKFDDTIDEGGRLKFLNNFKQLCYEGEITEIEEQKKLFLNVFPKNSIQYHFINCNFDKINSMKELFEYFHESVAEECKIIKNGSSITLKHVATGKYLSCMMVSGYLAVLFAGEKLLGANAIWSLNFETQFDKIFYGDTIYLAHKATGYKMCMDRELSTGHKKVTAVTYNYSIFDCINANPTNNNTPYVRTKDIITLKSSDNYILRSHDFTFAIGDKTFQEVVGHQGRIGGNDEWQIEFI